MKSHQNSTWTHISGPQTLSHRNMTRISFATHSHPLTRTSLKPSLTSPNSKRFWKSAQWITPPWSNAVLCWQLSYHGTALTPAREFWADFRVCDVGWLNVPHICFTCLPALASSILGEPRSLDHHMDWESVAGRIRGVVHSTVTFLSTVLEIL